MGKNQSAWIVGYILIAFVIYITIKGELPIYAGLLMQSPPQQAPVDAQAQTAQTATTIIKGAFAAFGM